MPHQALSSSLLLTPFCASHSRFPVSNSILHLLFTLNLIESFSHPMNPKFGPL